MVAQAPDLSAGWRIGLEELLTQSKRSDRQTHGFNQLPACESGDLHAAAAKVEEQAVRNRETSHGTGETVASFCELSNSLDLNPQLTLDALGEQSAVPCVAHCGRGHRDDALRSDTCRDCLKISKRLHRARHRGLAQLGAPIDVLDKPQRSA